MTPITKSAGDRLLLFVAAFGVGISLLMLSLSGASSGLSALAGSALALLNLVVLRSLVSRLLDGEIHTKLPFIALIFVKMGVLMGLVFVFISRHWVEPIAFTLGLSSLVVGMIAGSFSVARSGTRNEY
jgi:protein-S-isoprenylcysteine O-methyltransferase Ste14